jgi:FkbM family methyltransferase
MVAELVDFGDGFAAYTNAEPEARFIHNEIFIEHCYDICTFSDNPFCVDAGANIGMFTMYMKHKFPSARIIAFEPAPVTYSTLRRNIDFHGYSDVEMHQCALGSNNATDTLTFYPLAPGNSTFVPEEKEIMKTLLEGEHPQELIDKVFSTFENIDVPVKQISEFLPAGADLKDIDLLKIDVESRELDVCRGLDDEHWARVRNVAMEVFDLDRTLAAVESYITSKGFKVETELAIKNQNDPEKPKIYMLVGRRDTHKAVA